MPKNECDDAFAYVPDLGGYGVVVYSFKADKSWRVKHNFFYFDPLNGDYNVGSVNFQWTDGVFAMALGEQTEQGYILLILILSNKIQTYFLHLQLFQHPNGLFPCVIEYKRICCAEFRATK